MVRIERGIGELLEAARKTDDFTVLSHAADRCGRDACLPEFRKAQHPMRPEEVAGELALGPGFGHWYILSHSGIYSARFCIHGKVKEEAEKDTDG